MSSTRGSKHTNWLLVAPVCLWADQTYFPVNTHRFLLQFRYYIPPKRQNRGISQIRTTVGQPTRGISKIKVKIGTIGVQRPKKSKQWKVTILMLNQSDGYGQNHPSTQNYV